MIVLNTDEQVVVALSASCCGSQLFEAVWNAVQRDLKHTRTLALRMKRVEHIEVPAAGKSLRVRVRIDRMQCVLQAGEVVPVQVRGWGDDDIQGVCMGMRVSVPKPFWPGTGSASHGERLRFCNTNLPPLHVGSFLPVTILRVEQDGLAVGGVPECITQNFSP